MKIIAYKKYYRRRFFNKHEWCLYFRMLLVSLYAGLLRVLSLGFCDTMVDQSAMGKYLRESKSYYEQN